MGLLILLLVVAVVFTWLVVRSVRAGYGKSLFLLGWFVVGLCMVLSVPPPAPPAVRLFAQAWAYSLIAVPAWWAIAALRRSNRRPS